MTKGTSQKYRPKVLAKDILLVSAIPYIEKDAIIQCNRMS